MRFSITSGTNRRLAICGAINCAASCGTTTGSRARRSNSSSKNRCVASSFRQLQSGYASSNANTGTTGDSHHWTYWKTSAEPSTASAAALAVSSSERRGLSDRYASMMPSNKVMVIAAVCQTFARRISMPSCNPCKILAWISIPGILLASPETGVGNSSRNPAAVVPTRTNLFLNVSAGYCPTRTSA